MKLSYVTDSLAHLSLEEVLAYITKQDVYHIELATGGWSPAPHVNLQQLMNKVSLSSNSCWKVIKLMLLH